MQNLECISLYLFLKQTYLILGRFLSEERDEYELLEVFRLETIKTWLYNVNLNNIIKMTHLRKSTRDPLGQKMAYKFAQLHVGQNDGAEGLVDLPEVDLKQKKTKLWTWVTRTWSSFIGN